MEWEIIHTPFYQRLRWIKQLGFSSYVFPGAEHSRYGHSIGVMYNAQCILESIGISIPENRLFDDRDVEGPALNHKAIRIAALLHDLGTFPFSHTTEMAYVAHDSTGKNNHEELASFIIRNTAYENGITAILEKYNIDPVLISDLVRGESSNHLANQILHSEIDCDRMDYLLRDAHYTGLKYGEYDRLYLLHHFQVMNVGKKPILTININAIRTIEDFLSARFSWYSQVVRSPRGAKFDILAEEICSYLLKKKLIYTFDDLKELVVSKPFSFYEFNDQYFINKLRKLYLGSEVKFRQREKDIMKSILLQLPPSTLDKGSFRPRLLEQNDSQEIERVIRKAEVKLEEITEYLQKKGDDRYWVVGRIPKKQIQFNTSYEKLVKNKIGTNLLLERDPVKISREDGGISLLNELEDSIFRKLGDVINFIPNIYCSRIAQKELLKLL